ncbi:MAG TPA: Na-translocating system protein MpsC family protein [Thermoleophilaceae bacterium]|nr:Na-translocating system protein MpsC family protein [Thermoleophilaceae bacterium]
MTRLYKEQFGRGPTKVRTDWAGPDALICTLRDSLTPAERNLAAMGEHQRLRDSRLFFQHATEPLFVEAVERAIGREVEAFISGMDTRQDVSAEIFYFKPQEDT